MQQRLGTGLPNARMWPEPREFAVLAGLFVSGWLVRALKLRICGEVDEAPKSTPRPVFRMPVTGLGTAGGPQWPEVETLRAVRGPQCTEVETLRTARGPQCTEVETLCTARGPQCTEVETLRTARGPQWPEVESPRTARGPQWPEVETLRTARGPQWTEVETLRTAPGTSVARGRNAAHSPWTSVARGRIAARRVATSVDRPPSRRGGLRRSFAPIELAYFTSGSERFGFPSCAFPAEAAIFRPARVDFGPCASLWGPI